MDSPQTPLYVNDGQYAMLAISDSLNSSLKHNLVIIDNANGEVFRINEDGTLVGDLDAAIAVAEQHVRGYLPALRAIKRLRG
jgi:hypothetical protein